ncbi:hypothetical protein Bbelb_250800 [Branchiostoma belcheri]|nr:hypothetical protein Bbelb_250800 [Branchiostoma belcheri]
MAYLATTAGAQALLMSSSLLEKSNLSHSLPSKTAIQRQLVVFARHVCRPLSGVWTAALQSAVILGETNFPEGSSHSLTALQTLSRRSTHSRFCRTLGLKPKVEFSTKVSTRIPTVVYPFKTLATVRSPLPNRTGVETCTEIGESLFRLGELCSCARPTTMSGGPQLDYRRPPAVTRGHFVPKDGPAAFHARAFV